jgi:hypothetical protein
MLRKHHLLTYNQINNNKPQFGFHWSADVRYGQQKFGTDESESKEQSADRRSNHWCGNTDLRTFQKTPNLVSVLYTLEWLTN